uniref:Polyprotein-like protein n=1 Tax=Musa acuminata TaxID=4641 RepID=Q6RZV7_MUSAC|nr:polyprotein-like protein [Musa acuminata]
MKKIMYVLDTVMPTLEEGASGDEITRYVKMTEGTPVQNHILKKIEWIKKLIGLGMILEDDLQRTPSRKRSQFSMLVRPEKRKAEKSLKKGKGKGISGHIHEERIQKLLNDRYLDPFDYESYATCEPYLHEKMSNSPFSGIGERAIELYGHVYLMKYKSEAFEKFRKYKNEVKNKTGKSIKTLRSDRGTKRAVFLEKEHILDGDSGSMIELNEDGEFSSSTIPQLESVQVPNTQVLTLHRSDRVSHPPKRYVRHIEGENIEDIDPQTYEEGITSIDSMKRSYNFVKNEDEPCVYMKVTESAITFSVLYVDDILIISNDVGMLSTVKTWLSRHFSMKDLREASYILEIRIYRDRSKRILDLSQSRYIDTIVKRFDMKNSKRDLIPMRHGISLFRSISLKTHEERANMDRILYVSTIGYIIYVMLCTRPDIAYALSVMSIGSNLKVKGYTDSSFGSNVDDNKSNSGYVYTLNRGAVYRKSSKQDTTVDSTIEAEYIAIAKATKERVCMKKFITDL